MGAALGVGGAGEGEDGGCLQASGRWSVPGGQMERMWARPWALQASPRPSPSQHIGFRAQSFRCLEGLRRP